MSDATGIPVRPAIHRASTTGSPVVETASYSDTAPTDSFASFAGVEGDPGDLAVGMDKRVRIGFYPADAATGTGAPTTSAISGTVVLTSSRP